MFIPKKKRTVSLRADRELDEYLTEVSKENGITKTFASRLIVKFLKRHKQYWFEFGQDLRDLNEGNL